MGDITPIKPIKLCVNITIPCIDDDSISLYEAVGILGNKLQEAIQKINESLGSLEGVYSADNPPPYPVKSVNGMTGNVVITLPDNVYTTNNPPPYPVTSVNRAEMKDIITVFEPEGGDIDGVSQAELIAACKAGARLGAFNQDNGTCRLYHLNLYVSPERVEYSEVAGGGASGVTSVNNRTGAVNIFDAPINAASKVDVNAKANKSIVSDAWQSGKTYNAGAYCIYNDNLYKALVQTTAVPTNSNDWVVCTVTDEIIAITLKNTEHKVLATDYGNIDFYRQGKVVSFYGRLDNLPTGTVVQLGITPFALNIANVLFPCYSSNEPYNPVGSIWIYKNSTIELYKPEALSLIYVFGTSIIAD